MAGKEDKLTLLRSYLGNDDRQIKEMLELFLKTIPNDLSELSQLCKMEDIDGIQKTAHRLKSSLRFFGLNEVADLLLQMEITAKKESGSTLLINELAEKVNQQMKQELNQFKKTLNDL